MSRIKQHKLSEPDFERFRQLVKDASGIYFDHDKIEVLRAGLIERANQVGAGDLNEYYGLVSSRENSEELNRLLAHLSVQETQFFRNLPQFDAFRQFIIPEIARRKAGGERVMRFWCAGCSTGQEPYSVAMSVLDALPEPESWSIQILGTDLNEDALADAARGWYPARKLTGVDRLHLDRYFHAAGGGYTIDESVRKLVRFERLNLIDDPLPVSSFGVCDAVFCRNVIIYFTHETAKFVIEHFYDIMSSGAYLFLGHSETLWRMSSKYSLVEIGDAFIYRKPLPLSTGGRRFLPGRRLRSAGPSPGSPGERRSSRVDRRSQSGKRSDPRVKTGATRQKPLTDDGLSPREAAGNARVHLDRGEYELAIRCLEHGLAANAADPELYFVLGLVHEKMNEPAAAAEDFRRALYFEPDLGIARFHLASVFEQAGKMKNAVREYRNAKRSFKENPPGLLEAELEAFDADSLMNLCEWKIENLAGLES
ncbi:MAG: tetratricopeptide repeat protein [Actinobacteria bacterium]|nr:tetratricopeptide repeat protein [Actinomycetota bacterium]